MPLKFLSSFSTLNSGTFFSACYLFSVLGLKLVTANGAYLNGGLVIGSIRQNEFSKAGIAVMLVSFCMTYLAQQNQIITGIIAMIPVNVMNLGIIFGAAILAYLVTFSYFIPQGTARDWPGILDVFPKWIARTGKLFTHICLAALFGTKRFLVTFADYKFTSTPQAFSRLFGREYLRDKGIATFIRACISKRVPLFRIVFKSEFIAAMNAGFYNDGDRHEKLPPLEVAPHLLLGAFHAEWILSANDQFALALHQYITGGEPCQ